MGGKSRRCEGQITEQNPSVSFNPTFTQSAFKIYIFIFFKLGKIKLLNQYIVLMEF